jgi:hypothetical protein
MRSLLAVVLLAAATVAMAQEGFPLDGTWRGERKGPGGTPVTVVLVMQWDGHKITGLINPGPKSVQIADAQLVPDGWKVTLAAKNASGAPIAFEGSIGDLGEYNRNISGTWTEAGKSYPIRFVRE